VLLTMSFGRGDSGPKSYNFFVFAPTNILQVNYLIDHLAANQHSHIHVVLLNMGFKNNFHFVCRMGEIRWFEVAKTLLKLIDKLVLKCYFDKYTLTKP
jgi:hypothetical protein